MIKWCAYCQKFIGEIEPYHDFRLSHGICSSCTTHFQERTFHDLREVNDFFRRLFSDAASGKPIDPREIVKNASSIGIGRADLLVGILQPILYQIGVYFSEGKISVAKEHLFSEMVMEVTKEFENLTIIDPAMDKPKIILALCENNLHHIGIDFLSILIVENLGFRVQKYCELSTEELFQIICRENPQFFGLSLGLPEHWQTLLLLDHFLKDKLSPEARPVIAVGGPALKFTSPPTWTNFPDFIGVPHNSRELLQYLSTRFSKNSMVTSSQA